MKSFQARLSTTVYTFATKVDKGKDLALSSGRTCSHSGKGKENTLNQSQLSWAALNPGCSESV